MSVLSAQKPGLPAPRSIHRQGTWAPRAGSGGPEVAVLITDCGDVAALVRGFRTVLPRAQLYLYGADLPRDAIRDAEAAGATARSVRPSSRGLLIRRMFAEVEADIYILAHGLDTADVCMTLLMAARIDDPETDLVTVSCLAGRPMPDAGERLLARTVAFLYGRYGDGLPSDVMACSRRFARSYKGGEGGTSAALDLTLHALRLRMPVGEVWSVHPPREPAGPSPARGVAGWWALLRLVARLLVEERPRRVLGLAGLALVAAGIATALPTAPGTLVSPALLVGGAAVGAAGLLLDTLAKARQEVKRLGYLAIPRRAEPTAR